MTGSTNLHMIDLLQNFIHTIVVHVNFTDFSHHLPALQLSVRLLFGRLTFFISSRTTSGIQILTDISIHTPQPGSSFLLQFCSSIPRQHAILISVPLLYLFFVIIIPYSVKLLFCFFQKLQNRLRNLQLKWSSQEHYLHFAWENNMKSNSFLFSTFSRQHVLLMRIPYIFVFSLLYTLMLLTLRCQWWTSEGRTQTFTLFSVLPSSCQILNPTMNQRWIWLDRPRFHHHSCQNSVKEMFLSNEDFRKWSVMPSLKSIF